MKPPVIIAVVVAILLLGVGAIVMLNSKPTVSTSTSTPTEATTKTSNTVTETPATKMGVETQASFTGKLSDLFIRSESQKCTFKSDPNGKSMSGTYYTTNGRVRGDVLIPESGMTMNIIIQDKTMYYWTEKPVAMAFKMAIPDVSTTTTTPNQTTDLLTKEQVFDCAAWAVDESKFELPTGVTFTSMAGQ